MPWNTQDSMCATAPRGEVSKAKRLLLTCTAIIDAVSCFCLSLTAHSHTPMRKENGGTKTKIKQASSCTKAIAFCVPFWHQTHSNGLPDLENTNCIISVCLYPITSNPRAILNQRTNDLIHLVMHHGSPYVSLYGGTVTSCRVSIQPSSSAWLRDREPGGPAPLLPLPPPAPPLCPLSLSPRFWWWWWCCCCWSSSPTSAM